MGNYFSQCSLWLSHMSAPFDLSRLSVMHYYNPHDNPMNPNFYAQHAQRPYNGGGGGRWSTPAVSGKSVEVQRSQVDELFKSLQGGDNLPETEPGKYPITYSSMVIAYTMVYFQPKKSRPPSILTRSRR